MKYEEWTNGQITTYNNKRLNRSIIKNITTVISKFKVSKRDSNFDFVKIGMSRGLKKELNGM